VAKSSLTHPDGDIGTTNIAPEHEDDYVEYIADIVDHLQHAQDVVFTDIVPLNEPNWAWNDSDQEANRYAVADIKRIVLKLSRELAARDLTARILVPEAGEIMALLDDESFTEYWYNVKRRYNSQNLEITTDGKYREYAEELLGDPAIAPVIRYAISSHSYWSDTGEPPDDRLVRLREAVRADLDQHAPGAVYLQTEYCILGNRGPGRDLTMKSAIEVAEVIHRDLTILNAAEWSWWLAVSPHDYKDGLLYTDWTRPGDDETIFQSKIFFVLGQYSRFIRPGYTRIEAEIAHGPGGREATVLPSAFLSSDGLTQIIVVLNTDKTAAARVQISGLQHYNVYRTSPADGENLQRIDDLPPGSPLVLPPSSVTTLVSES
jgi:hypothetical protein